MSDHTTKVYSQFKHKFAGKLAASRDLHLDDVQELSTALALEGITDTVMWDRFTEVILAKENQMPEHKYFQNCGNFVWAFTKVNYTGTEFWEFMESVFQTELEKLKVGEWQDEEKGMTVLSTLCYALRDNKGYEISDRFWTEFNSGLRTQLRKRKISSDLPHTREQLEIIRGAIEANKNLDDSLLGFLK